ncbi:alpha/beta fold hydrolase [Tengunoibacter tsumagoiensis]|uniref:alpha/beta fold hydrolase n=1 Tax=Tengunoibacter tsumagoiensis TaxID=2014871 RepID=UPI000F82D769
MVTTYRYDQRSCGRSTGDPLYDVKTAVADLDALRAHWNLPQWIVLGHSWGATLALAYCLEYPSRVRALMYISEALMSHGTLNITAIKTRYSRLLNNVISQI